MSLRIANRLVSREGPVYIIAEAGVNHNGRLSSALRLVHAAREAGADAVKFQFFRADRLCAGNVPLADYQKASSASRSQRDMLRRLELSAGDFERVRRECRRCGLTMLASVFDPPSLGLLRRLRLPAVKIGSAEMVNLPLLKQALPLRIPFIVSTGMAAWEEIDRTYRFLRPAWKQPGLALLQCCSEYPSPPEHANLRVIPQMRRRYPQAVVGYSDHTEGVEAALGAVSLGARLVEKHLRLSTRGLSPDLQASLSPAAFRDFVRAIRTLERALGGASKKPVGRERSMRRVARPVAVAARALAAGHRLKLGDLDGQRRASGTSMADIGLLLGRRLKRAVAQGTPLKPHHLRQS